MYTNTVPRALQILDEIINLSTLGPDVILTLEHIEKVGLATASTLHSDAPLWCCGSYDTTTLTGCFALPPFAPSTQKRRRNYAGLETAVKIEN
jgi:hypothetical protein